jgi:hypothetical protein
MLQLPAVIPDHLHVQCRALPLSPRGGYASRIVEKAIVVNSIVAEDTSCQYSTNTAL